jgi:hypothetical protein
MGDQRKDEWPNLDDQSNKANEGGTNDSGNKSDVANELQELGQRLAATARTLWQSEQRQDLQKDVSDGLRMLRDQLSGAIDTVRANPKVQTLKDQVGEKVEAGRNSDAFEEVRAGLSTGLRTLNEQLQRFTERMERQDAAAAGAPPVPPTETAPSSGATMPEASGVVASDSAPPADIVTGGPLAEAAPATPKTDLPSAPEGPAADPQR